MAFGGGRHDPTALVQGLRAVLGEIPIIGGSAAGLITAEAATLTGFECGLLVFAQPLIYDAIATEPDLCDEYAAGKRLGAKLCQSCPSTSTILLFYDSLHASDPVELHVGSRLVEGFRDGVGQQDAALIGAGTLGDIAMSGSAVFDGHQARRHTAVAVAMPHALRGHIAITHGCFPASDYMTITRIDGARILELDGRPALTVAAERLDLSTADLARISPHSLAITLGEKQGDPFGPFADADYNNRLVMAADDESGALIVTEADFTTGTRIQLMGIEPQRMIDSAQEQSQQLLDRLGDEAPVFALYIDCAGRSMAFSGVEDDESAPVRRLIGARCPLLGFYSGVEIAPVHGTPRPLDWTGVLAVFTAKS